MDQGQRYDFGMIGLGVMGRNFILNVADSGYRAIGLDLDEEKANALNQEAEGENARGTVRGTTSMEDFVSSLKTPRVIMLLVPAGKVVDIVIGDLVPLLEKDDLIMDGGNSFFEDTDRRQDSLKEKGIRYLGVGVSGGAKGARLGPSIMPGGSREAYQVVAPILEEVSAKVKGEPCVAFMGNGSAGHFVKMVHNGIEYAMMQLLAESYDLLRRVAGFTNAELHHLYATWNEGNLQGYLVEITAAIFGQKDSLRGGSQEEGDLIDKILDKAKQKGTGKWTSQSAMDIGVPLPTIDAAVTMRGLSSFKNQRIEASKVLDFSTSEPSVDKDAFAGHMQNALWFTFLVSYAQGMSLLATTSEEKSYGLDLEAIARIWRGGCIIRAGMLEDIRKAYDAEPGLFNLLTSPVFSDRLVLAQASCRKVVKAAIDAGIPAMAFSNALAYVDAFRAARLPLNLVQAQRDYFGSHTYERTDRDGVYHTNWDILD